MDNKQKDRIIEILNNWYNDKSLSFKNTEAFKQPDMKKFNDDITAFVNDKFSVINDLKKNWNNENIAKLERICESNLENFVPEWRKQAEEILKILKAN